MTKTIIHNYGKISGIYLVGHSYDIQQLYLIFQYGRCFRVYLKGFFYLQETDEPFYHNHTSLHFTTPELAYQKLVYCDYEHPEQVISKASNSTLQTVLNLLLESI